MTGILFECDSNQKLHAFCFVEVNPTVVLNFSTSKCSQFYGATHISIGNKLGKDVCECDFYTVFYVSSHLNLKHKLAFVVLFRNKLIRDFSINWTNLRQNEDT